MHTIVKGKASQKMRDRMERLVVLPFSVGCISDSSVAVLSPLSKPHHHHHSPQGWEDFIPPELLAAAAAATKQDVVNPLLHHTL
ncbi:hypothetical protein HID58_004460 [Brassica napus]|uniref:Uncharacterized protein n=1 Tax=Brassica napus TaxID=3708 RepID=A0ABQ8E5V7_BRANA|nr:hypothetical protein HID58_004460 [Brassica napus]